MHWVAIDLGSTEIKASVLNKDYNPSRLLYPMIDYYTSRLSTKTFLTDENEIIIGIDAVLFGMINPANLIIDWKESIHKKIILQKLFTKIKLATVKHYDSENEIGAIVLYNEIEDSDVLEIANGIFQQVESVCITDAIAKAHPQLKQGITIIADCGTSAFKLSILENAKKIFYTENKDLAFANINIPSNIKEENPSNFTNEIIHGIIAERQKISLNNQMKLFVPYRFPAEEILTQKDKFEKLMKTYLYQCFNECLNSLSILSKTWNDVTNLIFTGGGACYHGLNIAFKQYMQDYEKDLELYNETAKIVNAQYEISFSAIQLTPRTNKTVILEF